MAGPVIETPPNVRVAKPSGRADLKWGTRFRGRWQSNYSDAQKFVDSEVLRHSEPYIPFQTGFLIQSGILGTDIGSGMVTWIAPYAKPQYYSARKPGSITGPLRGPYWFERAKAVHKREWVEGARRIAGRE